MNVGLCRGISNSSVDCHCGVIRNVKVIFIYLYIFLEKEMATHSSVLAWRIPEIVEPGGLPVYGVTQSQTRLK